MKKSKFTEEQIAYALRQVEAGTPPADVCRQLGVSEATFYIWKKKYAHLGVSELRRLRLAFLTIPRSSHCNVPRSWHANAHVNVIASYATLTGRKVSIGGPFRLRGIII